MAVYKGGCQCGAVRFAVEGPLGKASVCHCRMCQKAFGNVFAPLVSTRDGSLTWTKAEPARFQSSNLVRRGFCPACGTPLTYEAPDGVAVAIGAFDHPGTIEPVIHYGVERKVAWIDHMASWPVRDTLDDLGAAPFLDKIVSYQYKDEA